MSETKIDTCSESWHGRTPYSCLIRRTIGIFIPNKEQWIRHPANVRYSREGEGFVGSYFITGHRAEEIYGH